MLHNTFLLCLNLLSSITTNALPPPMSISFLCSSRFTPFEQTFLKTVVTLVSVVLLPHMPSSIMSSWRFLKPWHKLYRRRKEIIRTDQIVIELCRCSLLLQDSQWDKTNTITTFLSSVHKVSSCKILGCIAKAWLVKRWSPLTLFKRQLHNKIEKALHKFD